MQTEYQKEHPYIYSDFVRGLFKMMPTRVESLLHAAVGLAGEWLELSSARTLDHRIEEAGDCEFYIQAGFNIVGEPERFSRMLLVEQDWYEHAGDPLDRIKKTWVYNKPLDEVGLARSFLRVQENLHQYYDHFLKVPRGVVIDANVQKLRKRFPSGYTDAAAQLRADKAGEAA